MVLVTKILTSNEPLSWWEMIIEVGTGGRKRSFFLKAGVLSQLEQIKSCMSININTCPSLLILPQNIKPWVDRSLASI